MITVIDGRARSYTVPAADLPLLLACIDVEGCTVALMVAHADDDEG